MGKLGEECCGPSPCPLEVVLRRGEVKAQALSAGQQTSVENENEHINENGSMILAQIGHYISTTGFSLDTD